MNGEKLVILKLQGDLVEKGFAVTAIIKNEFGETLAQETGNLPPASYLLNKFDEWISELHAYAKREEVNNQPRVVSRSLSIEDLLCQQEQVISNSREKYNQAEKDFIEYFNKWLNNSSQLTEVFRELDNKVSNSDAVRVIIQTNNSQIKKLPWEKWSWLTYEKRKGRLFFSPIYQRSYKLFPTKNIRIQIILGDTENTQKELNILRRTFSEHEILPELINESSINIYNCLGERNYDILYFSGHGKTKEDIGRIYVNQTEYLEINQLNLKFKEAIDKGLKLAIFNSCQGLGLESELSQQKLLIPNLIIMRDIIHERVSQNFLEDLLNSFFIQTKPLHIAVSEVSNNLKNCESDYPGSSLMPILFQISEEPQYWQDWLVKPEKYAAKKPKLRMILVISLLITSLVMWGRWHGKLQSLELTAFDFLMRQRLLIEQPQRDKRLLIISISPQDIILLQQPPEETGQGARTLSDRTLEKLLVKLEKHQPQIIGLDIFREGSVDIKYPKLQEIFQNGGLITACFSYSQEYNRSISAPNQVPVKSIGFADFVTDEDDVIRRYLLVQTLNDFQYPCRVKQVNAFSLQLALSYLKKEGITRLDTKDDDFVQIGNVKFNPLKLHFAAYHDLDSDVEGGIQVILNYRPFQNYKKDISTVISLTDVLKDKLESDQIKDKIVLIGGDASDDIHKTSYYEKLPGVFVHAQMVTYLLDVVKGKQKIIGAWPWFLDIIWVWIWSFVEGIVVWIVPWKRGKENKYLLKVIIINGMILSTLYVFCFSFLIALGAWIPLIPSIMSMLITGLTVAYKVFPRKHINKKIHINTGKL